MRRIALPLVALAVLLLGIVGAALPASADDPLPPPAFPSGLSGPEDIGNDVGSDAQTETGPTYEITPGSAGTSLPAPNSAQVEDARAALDRLNGNKAEKTQTQVAGPVAGETDAAEEGDTSWYLIGAGLLVLLVLTELGRVNVAGARHRRRRE